MEDSKSWNYDKTKVSYRIRIDSGYSGKRNAPYWLNNLYLKNLGDDSLHDLDIKMHSTDSLQISFRSPSDHIYRLSPHEEKFLGFQVDAHGTTALYFSIRYFKEGGSFHWDSPWIREQVLGEVAELEGILVSNSYGYYRKRTGGRGNYKVFGQ